MATIQMSEILQTMVDNLLLQVKDKVPAEGDFPVVFEEYEVEDKSIGSSHIFLKVSHVSVGGTNNERYLELAALNRPSPYGAELVVKLGTTQDIISELQDPLLIDKLQDKLKRLIRDLEDV